MYSSFFFSEEKKSDAEKKEEMKSLVKDKKRAKDLDGGNRLAWFTRKYPGKYTCETFYFQIPKAS